MRKRKKRPTFILADSVGNEAGYSRPLWRRVRPDRVQMDQTPWDEIEDDELIRPYTRRRIPPRLPISDETSEDYQESVPKIVTEHVQESSFQKPESISVQNQDPHKHISNLKSILKQASGTLSLSEILQKKNLSLTELLSGDEKAFSSLTENPVTTTEKSFSSKVVATEEKNNSGTKGVSVEVSKKTEDRFLQTEMKENAKVKGPEINLKRLPTKTTIESTTERRIFVPSHPKYYTSLNFKPDLTPFFNVNPEKHESTTETLVTEKIGTNKSCSDNSKLPITNSKLKQISKGNSQLEKTNYILGKDNLKPIKISLPEVTGFKDIKTLDTVTKNTTSGEEPDKPMKVTIDLDIALIEKESEKTTTAIPLENTIYVTARDEIMEVLKDPASREKLSKILEVRNMTFEELVQQRERGSSQVHLADIFHNNSREPEPKEEIFVGLIESEDIGLQSDRQQKSRRFEHEHDVQKNLPELTLQIINKTEEIIATKDLPVPLSNLSSKVNTQTENIVQSVTIKTLYNEPEFPKNEKINMDDLLQPTDLFSNGNSLDGLEDTFALSSKDNFEVKELFSEDSIFFNLPSGVKSVIIVSLAIIGVSVVVFLTILLIFKWSQLKHKRSNYCNSLTSKFRAPILQGGTTAAIKTFMNETLGRRKTYYKNNVQRMCDDIWEGDKERKLSF